MGNMRAGVITYSFHISCKSYSVGSGTMSSISMRVLGIFGELRWFMCKGNNMCTQAFFNDELV